MMDCKGPRRSGQALLLVSFLGADATVRVHKPGCARRLMSWRWCSRRGSDGSGLQP
jgi:hypothetical protein